MSDFELQSLIEEAKGLEIENITKDLIVVRDTFMGNDKLIHFNKSHFEVGESLIQSFNNDITPYDVVEFIQFLPKVLFMNITKIFFVKSAEEIEALNSILDVKDNELSILEDEKGFIIINIAAHERKVAEDTKEGFGILGYADDINVKMSIQYSLLTELHRSMQKNPLFESEVEQGSLATQEFCEKVLFDS